MSCAKVSALKGNAPHEFQLLGPPTHTAMCCSTWPPRCKCDLASNSAHVDTGRSDKTRRAAREGLGIWAAHLGRWECLSVLGLDQLGDKKSLTLVREFYTSSSLTCTSKMATTLLAATMAVAAIGIYDMGPTYGKDYAGLDYNVTLWHSG